MIKFVKKRVVFCCLLLVLVVGAFLRLYRIYDYATFLGDEGRDALIVKRIIKDFDLTLLGPRTSVGDLYLGPFYYYLMVVPLWLFGLDPVGPAIMVALLGIATIFLIYKIGDGFFGYQVGIISATLYAFSQPVIRHTRFSWNPNPAPFFVSLTIYSLLQVVVKNEGFWLIICGACLGVLIQLHYITAVFWLTVFILLLTLRPSVKKKWWFFGFAGFVLLVSPILVFELRHQFVISKGLWRFFTQEDKIGFSISSLFSRMGFVYQRLFVHFLAADCQVLGLGLALLSTLVLLFSQVKKEAKFRILFFWWFFGVVGASLYAGKIHDHYLGFLFPVPFILTALLFEELRQLKVPWVGYCLLFALLVVNVLNLDLVVGRTPNNQIKRAKKVGRRIAQDAQGDKFNLALISPTMDFRAMNYRYFVEVFGAKPEGFESYADIDTLYVIMEQEQIPVSDVTAWEIASFGKSKVDDEWVFEEFGFRVLKMKKQNNEGSTSF